MKILRPESWPQAVRFLCEEQQCLENLPVVQGGLPPDAEEIDVLCLQYAARHEWPTSLPARDRDAILQRFDWARTLAATMLARFRKADGTETGQQMPYPDWEFEPMMIWFLVETWRTAEKLPTDVLARPLPPRPAPQWPPGPETN